MISGKFIVLELFQMKSLFASDEDMAVVTEVLLGCELFDSVFCVVGNEIPGFSGTIFYRSSHLVLINEQVVVGHCGQGGRCQKEESLWHWPRDVAHRKSTQLNWCRRIPNPRPRRHHRHLLHPPLLLHLHLLQAVHHHRHQKYPMITLVVNNNGLHPMVEVVGHPMHIATQRCRCRQGGGRHTNGHIESNDI